MVVMLEKKIFCIKSSQVASTVRGKEEQRDRSGGRS